MLRGPWLSCAMTDDTWELICLLGVGRRTEERLRRWRMWRSCDTELEIADVELRNPSDYDGRPIC